MSQQLRFAGIPGDMCICGRRQTIRHCPSCGGARIYGFAHPMYHPNLAGEIELVAQLYRCLGCGHRFTKAECLFCEAPAFGIRLAKERVQRLTQAQHTGEYLRPEDAKAAILLNEIIAENKAKVEAQSLDPDATPQEEPVSEGPLVEPGSKNFDAAFELRKEWTYLKLNGQAPTATSEEYVERRLKGELFQ